MSGSAPKDPYPAVRTDVRNIKNSVDSDFRFSGWNGERKPTILERGLMLVFYTLDVPVSVVTDTILLPFDLMRE